MSGAPVILKDVGNTRVLYHINVAVVDLLILRAESCSVL